MFNSVHSLTPSIQRRRSSSASFAVAQKCPTGQSAIYRQPIEIFNQNLRLYDFPIIPENFTKIFSLHQGLWLLQYFIPFFKTYTEEMESLVIFHVQRC